MNLYFVLTRNFISIASTIHSHIEKAMKSPINILLGITSNFGEATFIKGALK